MSADDASVTRRRRAASYAPNGGAAGAAGIAARGGRRPRTATAAAAATTSAAIATIHHRDAPPALPPNEAIGRMSRIRTAVSGSVGVTVTSTAPLTTESGTSSPARRYLMANAGLVRLPV